MKRVQSLYEEFICDRPLLQDAKFVISDDLAGYLRNMAIMQHSTLALCNAGRNEYNFLHRCGDDLHPGLQGVITVATLFELVHPADCSHFVEAWCRTFRFLDGLSTDQFGNYALVFECRLRNPYGEYRRIMFKYMLVEYQGEVVRGQLLMMLKPVCSIKIDDPCREVYIFNIHTCKFDRKFNPDSPTAREVELAGMSMQGYRAEDIARKLFISHKTVYNHFGNLVEKTRTADIAHAAMYLHQMGII